MKLLKRLIDIVFSIFTLIVFGQIGVLTSAAQTIAPIMIATPTADGIALYQMTSSDDLELIDVLAGFAVESYDGEGEWLLLGYQSLALSPDGQQLAITAQRETESAIFVYTFASDTLTQHAIPSYWLMPIWSPDGQAVLLKTAFPYFGTHPIPNHHVYDVAMDTLTQITFNIQVSPMIEWASYSTHLIYFGSCAPLNCGRSHNDLYLVSRDGSSRQALTDFSAQQASSTMPILVCNPTWSPSTQRWYYELGCFGRSDRPADMLYSVDLLGNNKLESDLALLYPSDAFINYSDIVDIHAFPSGIYVIVQAEILNDSLNGKYWRVLQITGGNPELIYSSSEMGTELDTAVQSPNGQRLAVSDGTDVWAISLMNSQIISHASTSNNVLCDIHWLDNQTLIYNQGGTVCDAAQFSAPEQVWQLNVETGVTTNLTQNLATPTWYFMSSSS